MLLLFLYKLSTQWMQFEVASLISFYNKTFAETESYDV